MKWTRVGQGPALCWIHGLGESSSCFHSILEHLPSFAHHLVDLPGYGRATRVATPYSLMEAADQLADDLQEIAPCLLIGHSMGGVVGLFLAEKHPRLLRGLINVDGNISLGDCGYSGPISRQTQSEFVSRGYGELLTSLQERGVDDLAHRGYFASMQLAQPEVVYTHSQDLVRWSAEESLARRMAELAVPSVYIAGAPGGAAERSLELLEKAKVETRLIGPSGHWPFIDQPEQFVEQVRAWHKQL